MSVLIDTSVWVDHFRRANTRLVQLITGDQALTHPVVLVELACGTLPAPRARTLHDIGLLQHATHATWTEVMELIEARQLYGRRCGSSDLTLLASTLMTPGASIWTLDKRLAQIAGELGVAYMHDIH
ncbi:MAG TPA: PIN domain-containing protein [Paraburkholderia sp.]|jgi:predicted nucleic acid-binding protein|uniref:type II toxin-antitoxin system VapC family toxin n=1 Tax=Paraburkholderia sp. TaxID=1926495 RepID=UPI002B477ECE|nr:PIN domain-containing protein [Paraburkholderia sp.]HKR45043.1 PIN domain-containing protein [Paraburkholderia sp.]